MACKTQRRRAKATASRKKKIKAVPKTKSDIFINLCRDHDDCDESCPCYGTDVWWEHHKHCGVYCDIPPCTKGCTSTIERDYYIQRMAKPETESMKCSYKPHSNHKNNYEVHLNLVNGKGNVTITNTKDDSVVMTHSEKVFIGRDIRYDFDHCNLIKDEVTGNYHEKILFGFDYINTANTGNTILFQSGDLYYLVSRNITIFKSKIPLVLFSSTSNSNDISYNTAIDSEGNAYQLDINVFISAFQMKSENIVPCENIDISRRRNLIKFKSRIEIVQKM